MYLSTSWSGVSLEKDIEIGSSSLLRMASFLGFLSQEASAAANWAISMRFRNATVVSPVSPPGPPPIIEAIMAPILPACAAPPPPWVLAGVLSAFSTGLDEADPTDNPFFFS